MENILAVSAPRVHTERLFRSDYLPQLLQIESIASLKVDNDRPFLDFYFLRMGTTLSNAPKSQDGFSASLCGICLLLHLGDLRIPFLIIICLLKCAKRDKNLARAPVLFAFQRSIGKI